MDDDAETGRIVIDRRRSGVTRPGNVASAEDGRLPTLNDDGDGARATGTTTGRGDAGSCSSFGATRGRLALAAEPSRDARAVKPAPPPPPPPPPPLLLFAEKGESGASGMIGDPDGSSWRSGRPGVVRAGVRAALPPPRSRELDVVGVLAPPLPLAPLGDL
jgi:hypothetical protein